VHLIDYPNMQELPCNCTCLRVLDYQYYYLPDSFFLWLQHKFNDLFCCFCHVAVWLFQDLLLYTFLDILQVFVMQCQDLALQYFLLLLKGSFSAYYSCISRVHVLQLWDLLLHTLLNDGYFFALILEQFLVSVFVFIIVEEREMWFVPSKAEC
jgi:hypothetical protein